MELLASATQSKTLFGRSTCDICAHWEPQPNEVCRRKSFRTAIVISIFFEYLGILVRLTLLKLASFRPQRPSGKRRSYLPRKTDNGLVVREIRSVGRRQARNEKGKYEESYIKHGVGVGRPVGVGAGITNNYHHDYDRGNWNHY